MSEVTGELPACLNEPNHLIHPTSLRRREILLYLKQKPPPCLSTPTFLQLRREGRVLVGIYPFGGGDLRTLALSKVQEIIIKCFLK